MKPLTQTGNPHPVGLGQTFRDIVRDSSHNSTDSLSSKSPGCLLGAGPEIFVPKLAISKCPLSSLLGLITTTQEGVGGRNDWEEVGDSQHVSSHYSCAFLSGREGHLLGAQA